MTIEQRAAEYHQSIIGKNPNAEAWGLDEAYKQGATDQQKIDDEEQADALFIQRQMLVEKACEALYGLMFDLNCDLMDIEEAKKYVRKAMQATS